MQFLLNDAHFIGGASVNTSPCAQASCINCQTMHPPTPIPSRRLYDSKMRVSEVNDSPFLISRLRGQKYPPSIPTLGNLEYYLTKPFELRSPRGHLPESSFPVPGPLDPTKRDGLLSYAYSLYDTFATGESPAGPDGPTAAHAPMLLPLLELLHGLDPSHLQTALLLGCVYHHQGLHQRALDMNRDILERYPNNVRCSRNVENRFADDFN